MDFFTTAIKKTHRLAILYCFMVQNSNHFLMAPVKELTRDLLEGAHVWTLVALFPSLLGGGLTPKRSRVECVHWTRSRDLSVSDPPSRHLACVHSPSGVREERDKCVGTSYTKRELYQNFLATKSIVRILQYYQEITCCVVNFMTRTFNLIPVSHKIVQVRRSRRARLLLFDLRDSCSCGV